MPVSARSNRGCANTLAREGTPVGAFRAVHVGSLPAHHPPHGTFKARRLRSLYTHPVPGQNRRVVARISPLADCGFWLH